MIPRYRPAIGLSGRFGHVWNSPDASSLRGELGLHLAFGSPFGFANLRQGLFAWFTALRQHHSGSVLMSAQICPVVPQAAIAAGLEVEFADIDYACPTPGPDQICRAIGAGTVAIVLAPLYGHMQSDWGSALDRLASRKVLLDLAQGIGWAVPPALLDVVSAAGYSFGVGKGVDSGGAVVLSREALSPHCEGPPGPLPAASLAKCLTLRAIMAAGLYSWVSAEVARASEPDADSFSPRVQCVDVRRAEKLWRSRLRRFAADVALARRRAAKLGEAIGGMRAIAAPEMSFASQATHLRQIIRLVDVDRRDRVLTALRSRGIDCAAAGERPPWTYLEVAAARYPNTARFRADAIRLPFMGRVTEAEFDTVRRALGACLA